MTVVSIQQPRYLPSMSYFDRIKRSDLHIVLDHVTLSKGDFVNRCQIMQRDGRPMWLTIPVRHGKPINETKVVAGRWVDKHRRALEQAYGYTPMWAAMPTTLDRVCHVSCLDAGRELGVDTPMMLSSDLGGADLGTKSTLILNLCKEVGATTYLSGPHGRDYLDLPAFEKAGIEVQWHEYPIVQPVLSAVHDLFGRERVSV